MLPFTDLMNTTPAIVEVIDRKAKQVEIKAARARNQAIYEASLLEEAQRGVTSSSSIAPQPDLFTYETFEQKFPNSTIVKQATSQLQIKVKTEKAEFGTDQWAQREVEKSYQAVIRKELQTVARNQLYENPNSYAFMSLEAFAPLKLHIEKMNGVNTASSFVYVTISPDTRNTSQSISNLKALIDKASKKCFVENWLVTFEQRGIHGTPEYGTGIHINFLLKKGQAYMSKAPTDICREFRNTFKSVIGENCLQAVDYRYSNDPTNFLNYFAGFKDWKDHNPDIVMSDHIWRVEEEIAPYYSSTGWDQHIAKLAPEVQQFYADVPHY